MKRHKSQNSQTHAEILPNISNVDVDILVDAYAIFCLKKGGVKMPPNPTREKALEIVSQPEHLKHHLYSIFTNAQRQRNIRARRNRRKIKLYLF